MPVHKHCLLWSTNVGTLILKCRSKMANSGKLQDSSYLTCWDLSAARSHEWMTWAGHAYTWTIYCGPLMHIASFWISGPRCLTGGKSGDFPLLTCLGHSTVTSQCVEVDLDNKVHEHCLLGSNDAHAISYLTLQSKIVNKRIRGLVLDIWEPF